jgi:predicted kinase
VQTRTGLPLLAKDTIKEVLGGSLGVTRPEDSKRLGAAVFALMGTIMHELLAHGVSLIVEGNFAVGWPQFDDLPPARIVQVHVTAPVEVLLARMRERGSDRHPVHYDAEAAEEIGERVAGGEWDALPLPGRLLRIDTSSPADLDRLLAPLDAVAIR